MNTNREFVIGADISWYPHMVRDGFVFRNAAGQPEPLLSLLRDYGFNAVRLRTWVHPTGDGHSGGCSAEETAALAQECAAGGFRVMIDFHYSDSWADPAHQVKPAAWASFSQQELEEAVYAYTRDTLRLIRGKGVVPEWVQIGNEINPGMLLPEGSAENMPALSRLITAGHRGAKEASPETQTMVHLAEFNVTDFVFQYFDALEENRCEYDMMGFSFYPYHIPRLTREECFQGFARSMREIPARYGRDLMIVETGDVSKDEEATADLLRRVLADCEAQPRCKGVMLWEPEGAEVWSHYPLSAWRDDGTPSAALNVLRDFRAK